MTDLESKHIGTLCCECGIDMGIDATRQLCDKMFCSNLGEEYIKKYNENIRKIRSDNDKFFVEQTIDLNTKCGQA
jgi:hypothetical protein